RRVEEPRKETEDQGQRRPEVVAMMSEPRAVATGFITFESQPVWLFSFSPKQSARRKRTSRMFRSLTVLALAAVTACAQPPATQTFPTPTVHTPGTIKLTYVGNEGVLISDGTKAVLIDGLHRKYDDDYLNPPPDVLAAMEAGKPPFDQVRVVLVSHVHGDHFSAESVGLHLKNNPKAVLVSDAQKMGDIARLYADHALIRDQTAELTPAWKQSIAYEKDGIKVTLLGMKHGSDRFWWIKNLGHIIEIGGKKLFHFGDADNTMENFAAFNLAAEKIDIAFIPYWFLLNENGRKLVRETIAAKHNIAVHISPQNADADAANVKKLSPGVDAFTKMLEERSY
ncbi:MAG: MBL fold metallo-hydrolase, partial [bacterium]|nr:MBL fold metallo-hydrolase [bacterium]